MNTGVVIYAHNSRYIDYAVTAIVSGSLAKKNLQVPVTLITDASTIDWMKTSGVYNKAESLFDSIIEVIRPETENQRIIFDCFKSQNVPFINSNRSSVWELTPYDRTLLIDSDYLIFNNSLNEYWQIDQDLLMSPRMNDIRGDRFGILDTWVSETGIQLYWATTVLFTKNDYTKIFFDLVQHIKENYFLYSEIYRFNPKTFRNDIAFSIAKHIVDGFETQEKNNLPELLTVQDKDTIVDINDNNITVLIKDPMKDVGMNMAKISKQNVHMMNKEAIVRNFEKFMEFV